jgi:hypothetical protein
MADGSPSSADQDRDAIIDEKSAGITCGFLCPSIPVVAHPRWMVNGMDDYSLSAWLAGELYLSW